jgi:ribosomal protein S18 acetylase RimI-like enzyme
VTLTTLAIRRPRLTDVHAIAELQLLSWQRTYDPLLPSAQRGRFTLEERVAAWHRVLRWPNPREALWVAEFGPGLIGVVWSGSSADSDADTGSGEIHSLHVHPDHHGRGVGTELLGRGRGDLRRRGFDVVTLWVLKGNRGAQAFYLARQWVRDTAVREAHIGGAPGLPVVTELRFVYVGRE